MAANLEAATGRSVAQWTVAVAASGAVSYGEAIEWLKREHGLGHFQARLVVEAARDGGMDL